tara:strand:+ start:739 stop:1068 length:330 start_codon:yes stop_codon:yes gene_type:complete
MRIKSLIYILLACYLGTLLRFFIDNNLVISIIGSFLVGFVISKRLIYKNEKIILSGFVSCFTSFSGFILFLFKTLNQGGWIKFVVTLNLTIIMNLFTMYIGYWISRKIT